MVRFKVDTSFYAYISLGLIGLWPLLYLLLYLEAIQKGSTQITYLPECIGITFVNLVVLAIVNKQVSSVELRFIDGLHIVSARYSSGCANITIFYMPIIHVIIYVIMSIVAIIGFIKGKDFTEESYFKLINPYGNKKGLLEIILVLAIFVLVSIYGILTLNRKNSVKPSQVTNIPTSVPTFQVSYSIATKTPIRLSVKKPNVDSWRMPFMTGYKNILIDTDANQDMKDFAVFHARNLAIASPYRWEIYTMPNSTSFSDVESHYIPNVIKRGYRLARDEYNNDLKTGLISFVNSPSLIYIQYWDATSDMKPMVLIYYKEEQ